MVEIHAKQKHSLYMVENVIIKVHKKIKSSAIIQKLVVKLSVRKCDKLSFISYCTTVNSGLLI